MMLPPSRSPLSDLTACIKACTACHDICQRMIFQHCLPAGGQHTDTDHLQVMTDCAEICRVAADFMLRGSARHVIMCRACAEICEACAADCERVGGLLECVRACRECAELCRELAGVVAA